MTGFGLADGPLAGGRVHVEIRTVNHRHFNVQLRLAPEFQPFEDALGRALRKRIARGHVAVSVRWAQEPEHRRAIAVDVERARSVVAALTQLKHALDLEGEIDMGFVARQPDVLVYRNDDNDLAIPADAFLSIVSDALSGVITMREREGAALATDLRSHLESIRSHLVAVRERAPQRLTAERDRLRTAVGELLDGREVDETRLAQEIAYLAERLDINEEIVRLETHLDHADAALAGDEPSGRALAFLSQEMLREINTIGSKANDAAITTSVIAMKGELEKFREQLENME